MNKDNPPTERSSNPFPILTDQNWRKAIRMARKEPNLVREALRKALKPK